MVEMDIRKFMLDGLNLSTVTGTFGLFSGTSRQLTTYNITSGVSRYGRAMVYTIPPMTSFVVELSSSATNPYLRIHPSMAVDHSAAISSAPAESVWSNPDGVLLIEASRNGLLSSCVFIEDASAVSGCKDGEVSTLLMLSERMTPGAVFTVGGNEALAINVVPHVDVVALGFSSFLDDMSDQLVLLFTG